MMRRRRKWEHLYSLVISREQDTILKVLFDRKLSMMVEYYA